MRVDDYNPMSGKIIERPPALSDADRAEIEDYFDEQCKPCAGCGHSIGWHYRGKCRKYNIQTNNYCSCESLAENVRDDVA